MRKRLVVAFAAVLAGPVQAPAQSPADPGPIRAVRVLTDAVARGGRFELGVDLAGPFANPFDFDEVLVQGHFVPPSGKEVVVGGFHFRDFERALEGRNEKLAPKGEPEWRVRFTPAEAGAHRWWVTAKTKAGASKTEPKSFTAAPAPFKGFIRTGSVSKLHFEFDDGSPYFAVGENVCWPGSRGTYDYDDWFGKLAEAGGNYARLWIGPFDSFTLEAKAGGLGRYDLANA